MTSHCYTHTNNSQAYNIRFSQSGKTAFHSGVRLTCQCTAPSRWARHIKNPPCSTGRFFICTWRSMGWMQALCRVNSSPLSPANYSAVTPSRSVNEMESSRMSTSWVQRPGGVVLFAMNSVYILRFVTTMPDLRIMRHTPSNTHATPCKGSVVEACYLRARWGARRWWHPHAFQAVP